MEIDELRNRVSAARNFSKQQGLPDDVRGRLQQIAQEARAELDTRAAAQQQQETPPAASTEQPPAPADAPPAAADQAPVEQAPVVTEQPTDQPAVGEQAPAGETQPVVKIGRAHV